MCSDNYIDMEEITMPRNLEITELKDRLKFVYSRNNVLAESKIKRKKNIVSFLNIPRDGLQYGVKEKRILLYKTLKGEKIYIQYPGKESTNKIPRPLDFRPELENANGVFMENVTFGYIWDILDEIGTSHNGYLSLIAALFLRLEYMYDYQLCAEQYESYVENIETGIITEEVPINLEWYRINLDDDVWYTLNDRIGDIKITDDEVISFEAFIKFVDLLFQNEDCKYYYINHNEKNKVPDIESYNLNNGRNSSGDANLAILSYLQKKKKLSILLNEFQKGRGVTNFKKGDYQIVTDGLVINVDIQ